MLGKAFRLSQQFIIFINQGVAIPCQISRRFSRAGGRVHVSSNAFARLGGTQVAAIFGFANGDIAGREIRQDSCPGEGGVGARRNRRPNIFANLYMQPESLDVLRLENQAIPERDVLSQKKNFAADGISAGGELALLVELTIIGQIGFRHEAQDTASVDHHAAVEQLPIESQRRANNEYRRQIFAFFNQTPDGRFAGFEQRVLMKEILIGISRNPQLGENPIVRSMLKAGSATRSEGTQTAARMNPCE